MGDELPADHHQVGLDVLLGRVRIVDQAAVQEEHDVARRAVDRPDRFRVGIPVGFRPVQGGFPEEFVGDRHLFSTSCIASPSEAVQKVRGRGIAG
ncbi:MAG TPA: hypothetical protein VHC49_01155 [Mycobacteriales bacterium]|nr:hypothetical protein [Mycobacteriales bacterium]